MFVIEKQLTVENKMKSKLRFWKSTRTIGLIVMVTSILKKITL